MVFLDVVIGQYEVPFPVMVDQSDSNLLIKKTGDGTTWVKHRKSGLQQCLNVIQKAFILLSNK